MLAKVNCSLLLKSCSSGVILAAGVLVAFGLGSRKDSVSIWSDFTSGFWIFVGVDLIETPFTVCREIYRWKSQFKVPSDEGSVMAPSICCSGVSMLPNFRTLISLTSR